MKSHYSVFTVCICLIFACSTALAEEKESAKKKADDLENPIKLESTFVGDKEQPGVSYFIPWKGTSAPDKLYWNIEDKNDQTLEMVDRDVMLRSINIYNEMDLEKPMEE
ncbi:hypothetical protein [Teredinibacter sp. KSP-S5-2]|uniref:hypothetical protein n=1 Tax=Teredinibacter sp. KSP-S5-2 TaxID=3034506 RepID=UPI0029342C74|nr:hypothetical protein [Teredinibacter sp. KSP-S5-2]WNO10724.1 hypothetical protein P5V12_06000 [Teredinibacter sp. KSP-S5-2]